MSMFPSYQSKSDMKRKWDDLLKQTQLDNVVQAAKQEMFKEMVWPSDVDQKSIKSFTKPTDTLKLEGLERFKMSVEDTLSQKLRAMQDPQYSKQVQDEIDKNKPITKADLETFADKIRKDTEKTVRTEIDSAIEKMPITKLEFEAFVKSHGVIKPGDKSFHPIGANEKPNKDVYVNEEGRIKTKKSGADSKAGINYQLTYERLQRKLSQSSMSSMSSKGSMHRSEFGPPPSNREAKEMLMKLFKDKPSYIGKFSPIAFNDNTLLRNLHVGVDSDGIPTVYHMNGDPVVFAKEKPEGEIINWYNTFNHIKESPIDPTEGAIRQMGNLDIRGQSDSSSSYSSASSNASMGKGFSKIRPRHRMGGMAIGKADVLNKDYLWRPIGSKFINLKSLGQGFLSLRHPSNQPVGKRIKLNDDIMDMIREYIYDGKFDMDKYESLDQTSKEFMYDLLKVTRLTNAFKKPLKDPRIGKDYNAELDKLVGEIRVGNDNKANKDELKRILLHMIETKTISDSKLRSLMPLI